MCECEYTGDTVYCRAQMKTVGTSPQCPPCLNLVSLMFDQYDAVYQLAGLGASFFSLPFLYRVLELRRFITALSFYIVLGI